MHGVQDGHTLLPCSMSQLVKLYATMNFKVFKLTIHIFFTDKTQEMLQHTSITDNN